MKLNLLIPVDTNMSPSTIKRSVSSLPKGVVLHVSFPESLSYIDRRNLMRLYEGFEVHFYDCMKTSPDRRNQIISFLEGYLPSSDDYVMFMDADDELSPTFLREFRKVTKSNPEAVFLNCLRKDIRTQEVIQKPYMDYLNASLETYLKGRLANVPWGVALRCDIFEDFFHNLVYPEKCTESKYEYGDEFRIQNLIYFKSLSSLNFIKAPRCIYLWCYDSGYTSLSMRNLTPESIIDKVNAAMSATINGRCKCILGYNTLRSSLKMVRKVTPDYKYIWEEVKCELPPLLRERSSYFPKEGDAVDGEVYALLSGKGYEITESKDIVYNSLEDYEKKQKDYR